ncbi:MAG: hypothetical protein ABIA63_01805 [bacterium]
MSEYLIFDQNYLDIPLQDLPDIGDYVVCKDPQHRLNNSIEKNETWAVVEIVGEEVPPKAHGLFWEKEMAIYFARALTAIIE